MPAAHNSISETCSRLLLSAALYIFNAVSEAPKKKTKKKTSKPATVAGGFATFAHAFYIYTESQSWSSQSREMGPVTGQDKPDGTAAVD